MSKKKTIFSSTQERAVAMNIKVPLATKTRIDELKEALRQADESLIFNVSKICCDALLAAVKRGESELSKMRRSGPTKSGGASSSAR